MGPQLDFGGLVILVLPTDPSGHMKHIHRWPEMLLWHPLHPPVLLLISIEDCWLINHHESMHRFYV